MQLFAAADRRRARVGRDLCLARARARADLSRDAHRQFRARRDGDALGLSRLAAHSMGRAVRAQPRHHRGRELRDGRARVPADDPAGARRLGSHDGGDLHRVLRRLRGDLPVVLGRRPARVPAPLPGPRLDHRRRAAHRQQSRHPGDAVRHDRRLERAVPLHAHRACDARLGGRAREEPAGRHSGRDHADARLGPRRDRRLHRGGADRARACSSRRR